MKQALIEFHRERMEHLKKLSGEMMNTIIRVYPELAPEVFDDCTKSQPSNAPYNEESETVTVYFWRKALWHEEAIKYLEQH